MTRSWRGRAVALMVVVAVAGLTGCGSDGSDRSDSVFGDRQAFMENRAIEICVGDGTYRFEMRLKFDENFDANGKGPFPLQGGWCGSSWPAVRGNVYAADGSRVMEIEAGNPPIGYPYVRVTCRPDSRSDPNWATTPHAFNVDEAFSFACNPYKVDVVRERDSTNKKHFDVMVNPN